MYFQDHNPPHFNAEYRGMKRNTTSELKTAGRKTPQTSERISAGMGFRTQSELMNNWQKAVIPATLDKIKPLN